MCTEQGNRGSRLLWAGVFRLLRSRVVLSCPSRPLNSRYDRTSWCRDEAPWTRDRDLDRLLPAAVPLPRVTAIWPFTARGRATLAQQTTRRRALRAEPRVVGPDEPQTASRGPRASPVAGLPLLPLLRADRDVVLGGRGRVGGEQATLTSHWSPRCDCECISQERSE